MVTNDHCLQSPVHVPCYYHRLKIQRAFNMMREEIDSCTTIPLDTLYARAIMVHQSRAVITRDYDAVECFPVNR